MDVAERREMGEGKGGVSRAYSMDLVHVNSYTHVLNLSESIDRLISGSSNNRRITRALNLQQSPTTHRCENSLSLPPHK